ncbi:hypothetical protein, partial [Rosistilla oblonga]|uniref:hypothetical protein n=1 Tax=Rosistilla oblonga TaxID=2527990 RepID=UPI003A96F9F8
NSNWKNVEISAGLADRPLLENASQRWEPGLTPNRLIKPTSCYRVAADTSRRKTLSPLGLIVVASSAARLSTIMSAATSRPTLFFVEASCCVGVAATVGGGHRWRTFLSARRWGTFTQRYK